MEWTIENGRHALEKMQQRASCRNFSDKEIPDEILKSILETGLRAASGGNLQPYSIIVVKDKEKKEKLAELNCDQKFMAQAPVNLVFVLDLYRNSRLAKLQDAPYTVPKNYMHYLISAEDVMCAAQTIETAAWLMGIGSVYIGTSNYEGKKLAELLNLPEYTYPIVILSMGYPKHELSTRSRLPYEATVFEESYPEFTESEIQDMFASKYGNMEKELSKAANVREEILERMQAALLAAFSPEEAEKILAKIKENNKYMEFQYRFGLHYHAAEMLETSKEVLEMMKENGLEPFSVLEK